MGDPTAAVQFEPCAVSISISKNPNSMLRCPPSCPQAGERRVINLRNRESKVIGVAFWVVGRLIWISYISKTQQCSYGYSIWDEEFFAPEL